MDHAATTYTSTRIPVKSAGKIHVDIDDLSLDLVSLSAHKFYGPNGVGALYARDGVELESLIHGGGQERGLRSGTKNVAGLVGMGKAADLAMVVCSALPPCATWSSETHGSNPSTLLG
ncbi:aminotransferase class V-fold PLP-dependent enzyme [Haladaptatus salinisoli]|uniref:aminotransferase class V-fold PLP-dependent enzyme n=1 Tax=Haladaptatus salinisoli TaxID=2884876 RepID=UPI001D09A86F|nr:aminotransferase class V-fold PLP-dependent enzyme [Haladaptatus salinisoli]